MHDISKVDDTTLIDLLADYTNRYTKLFPQEAAYKECKVMLDSIIAEIIRRKKGKLENKDHAISNANIQKH
jgi:hypothetical protein